MNTGKKNIKVFVSHRIDLDSTVIKNNIFYPVRCGAVYDKRETSNKIAGDDTGNNISERRESFCELTVMYWAWKNIEADYYGLCHYRRYMSFCDDKNKEDIYGNICKEFLDNESIQHFELNNEEKIHQIVESNDFLFTKWDMSKLGYNNIYEQYKSIPVLHKKDLDIAIEILYEKYPSFIPFAKKYLSGRVFYPCQIFIMKKDIFNEYCLWLFDILFETEKRINIQNYSLEEKRAIGHIAERLLGIFITYLIEKKTLKYQCLQRILFINTEAMGKMKPYYSVNNIPIVLSSSDFFVPYMALTIESMLKNASQDYNYDIIILHTNITKKMKYLLNLAINNFKNATVRFWNISPYVENFKFRYQNVHFSIETFYRLLAPELFSEYEKIIYLDSDLIICDDISQLYNLDIKDNLLAATIDADFCGEYNGGNPIIKPYVDNVLQLKNPYQYFQAGVLILSIKNMRETLGKYELFQYANKKKFIYVDQDVLNCKCQGKVFYLDMEWNVLIDCANIRIREFISKAPAEIYKRYLQARNQPKIIHFAGFEKPWNNAGCDFSEYFWLYARKSVFYEIIIQRMVSATILYEKSQKQSLVRRIADKFLPKGSKRRQLVKFFIPRGSKQWNILKKIYHMITME